MLKILINCWNHLGLLAFADSASGTSTASTPVPAGTEVATSVAGGAAAAGAPQQPGMLGMFLPFILMFVVVYFLMIRPQQKRMKQHQNLLAGLAQGDEVVTASGMIGKVTGMTEKVVTLEVAKDVKVKFLKSQVSQVIKGQIQELV